MEQSPIKKNSPFSSKRYNMIKDMVSQQCSTCTDMSVLEESIMEGIRKIMHFDENTKYYDEKKKKSIYEYRARLKAKKLAECNNKTT